MFFLPQRTFPCHGRVRTSPDACPRGWLFPFPRLRKAGFTQEQDVLSLLVSFLFLFFFPIKFSDISRTVLGWGSRGLEPTSSGFDGARAGAAGEVAVTPPPPSPTACALSLAPEGEEQAKQSGSFRSGDGALRHLGSGAFPPGPGGRFGAKAERTGSPTPKQVTSSLCTSAAVAALERALQAAG